MTEQQLLGSVDRAASCVRLQRALPASPDEVWDALTDPVRLAGWLAPVERGNPAPGETFMLRMNDAETATCTVITWHKPYELRLRWDYTGEGASELTFRLSEADGGTILALEHQRIPDDPVQYGAEWHVFLEQLAAHLSTPDSAGNGCSTDDFLATYRALRPRYEAAATG